MNKLKKPPAKARPAPALSIQARKRFIRVFNTLHVFGYIEIRRALRLMPFLLFWSLLALLFIANSYYTEKKIREIDRTGKEIKELRSEYISTKSDLMMRCGQSQVATAVAPLGLEESREAPARIVKETPPEK